MGAQPEAGNAEKDGCESILYNLMGRPQYIFKVPEGFDPPELRYFLVPPKETDARALVAWRLMAQQEHSTYMLNLFKAIATQLRKNLAPADACITLGHLIAKFELQKAADDQAVYEMIKSRRAKGKRRSKTAS